MQQEIKLTNENSNTVFVDDVDVSKGVYAKHNENNFMLYIGIRGGEFMTSATHYDNRFNDVISAFSLVGLIETASRYTFYTIPDNKRIVTEREVTIDDLKNTDHVGFVDKHGDKGFIICNGQNKFTAISGESYGAICNGHYSGDIKHETLLNALSEVHEPRKIIRLTTRKELYQWLAE